MPARLVAVGAMLGAVVVCIGARAAVPSRITEFAIGTLPPGVTTLPLGIVAGPDGNLWFTESGVVTSGNKKFGNSIARITPAGKMTEFPLPTPNSAPWGIAAGPDGNLWFTEWQGNRIGRITRRGKITEFPLPTADSLPQGIAAGPDGNLWFTVPNGDKIGRITPAGKITEFPLPGSGPVAAVIDAGPGIAAGPDGNLWLAGQSGNIGRVSTDGQVTVFPTPDVGSTPFVPNAITAGPDGNLWFTEAQYGGAGKIGRITPSGQITAFPIPTADSKPMGIAAGADGNLWFTEAGAGKIGRITPAGQISEFSIPTAAGGPWGITAGPDGTVWFVENVGNKIGRVGVGARLSPRLIDLTGVTVGNGNVTVSWRRTGVVPGSPIASYLVTAVPWGNDRRDRNGRPVRRATRTTGRAAPSDTSGTVGGLIADCHQVYELTVTPIMGRTVGPVARWPHPVRPSGIVSPTEPDRVVILLDGIGESKPAERFDPYKPTRDGMPSYCPEAWSPAGRSWAESDFSGSPHGPWEFFNKWNFADPGSGPAKTGNSTPRLLDRTGKVKTHEFMLDAVAAEGSAILPYSYNGATLSKPRGGGPVFTFKPYGVCVSTPGCGPPINFDVEMLNKEIASIHSVWPESELIIVGHSQGGLIAFEWWLKHGYQAARGSAGAAVAAVFTLDSPVNGVCAVSVICGGPPSYPDYGDRLKDDKKSLAKDAAAGWPVHFIGTSGDTVPIGPLRSYGSRGKENLQHELMLTGDRCVNQHNHADCPSPPDHVSGCPITDNGPSWIDDDQHFIVKFCPDNVAYFDNVLGLNY